MRGEVVKTEVEFEPELPFSYFARFLGRFRAKPSVVVELARNEVKVEI